MMVVAKGKKMAGDKKGKETVDSNPIEHQSKPPTPVYPEEKDRRDILEANLKKMGCGKLWDLPWRYADDFLVNEIAQQRSVNWPDTIRGKPEKWTSELLAQKWGLSLGGKNLPARKVNLAEKYFEGRPSGGDGWKLADCRHQELREVLEFLIPLLNPNKPKRVTVQVASAVVDCLLNNTNYSWARIFEERIKNQVLKLQNVRVSFLAAYCLNLYQTEEELLTKKERKAWEHLKWSLVHGHEYTKDPDNQQSPDKGGEDGEETESDKEEDPIPDKSSKPETTPRKSERLAEEKRKPVEEKRYTAEEKGKLAEEKKHPHSEKFQPSVGGDHIPEKFPDKFTPSGIAEQTVWWANKTAAVINKLTAQHKETAAKLEKAEAKWKEATGKVAQLESQLKEAAIMLCCKPENIAAGIKEKLRVCNTVEDFQIQARKDQQKLAEYEKERSMLRVERAILLTQVEQSKNKDAWNEKALSRLEEANLTVKKLAKLDTPGRIRTEAIDKFLEKGHVNYKPIFDTLSKFTAEMEEALEEFQNSLHPLKEIMKDLHTELRRRREAPDDDDYSGQGRMMKRRRVIPADTDDEFSDPEEGRSPVKIKVELEDGKQEAQGPDMTMSKKEQEETSSKPSPNGQTSKIPEEPSTTVEGLAGKELEEGKL
jgi:hypothetical protein